MTISKKKRAAYDYFAAFAESADCAYRAALLFQQIVADYKHDDLPRRMDEMHAIEHEADSVHHRSMDQLAREFLPPIEREDIVSLSQALDDVVDAIDDITRRIAMYGLTSLRPDTAAFGQLLVDCTRAMHDLTQEFRHFRKSKKLRDLMVKLNSLETEGDSLHFAATSLLFAEENDAKQVLIWATLYDEFENCVDSCESVASLIEGVVLKNT